MELSRQGERWTERIVTQVRMHDTRGHLRVADCEDRSDRLFARDVVGATNAARGAAGH